MYCEKCGSELKDNEMICNKCGCARNYNKNKFSVGEDYSSVIVDNRIKTADDLKRDIKNCKILAILATVFCLGIGIIFSFLFNIKLRKILKTEYKDVTNISYTVNQELKKYIILSSLPGVVGFATMFLLPITLNNK